jgi:hypothetical protein
MRSIETQVPQVQGSDAWSSSVIRWLFYIPTISVLVLPVIALEMLILHALAEY